MEISLTITRDKQGIHVMDELSSHGLDFNDREELMRFLKSNDDLNKYERAMREALREIATRDVLDTRIEKKQFTYTPAKVTAQWP